MSTRMGWIGAGRMGLAMVAVVVIGAVALVVWQRNADNRPRLEWDQPAASLAEVQKLRFELRLPGTVVHIQPVCSESTAGFTCRVPLDEVPTVPFEVCALDQSGMAECTRFDAGQ